MYGNIMMKKMVLLLLFPLIFGCTSKKEEDKNNLPSVLVTIAPYAYFTEKIAGDTVSVETLVPPGVNLHIFEPKPNSIQKSGKALVWFQIDEPFEKKIAQAFLEKNPNMELVSLQKGLPLLSPHSAIELGSICSHDHGDRDLHTWTSPRLALEQAKKIADTLIALFPEHKELYKKNFNDLAKDLQLLNRDLAKMLAFAKGDAILVSHPSLAYFCQEFGLMQLSVECEGKDPRPRDIEKILQQTETYTVRCVFLQQGFNDRGAQLIAKKLKLPAYRIDPYAKDYLKNMRQIGQYIAK